MKHDKIYTLSIYTTHELQTEIAISKKLYMP